MPILPGHLNCAFDEVAGTTLAPLEMVLLFGTMQ
jgi:hypothetical protein